MPPALCPGDHIAIVSPASVVKSDYVNGMAERIKERGFEPLIMPYALCHEKGSYSADRAFRLKDIQDALKDPDIRAIFCARGGYGCVQLLPHLDLELVADNPKWIIGFSDVSALLALWYKAGIASIHGPMAKHLSQMAPDDPCTNALFNILENSGRFDYLFPSGGNSRNGLARGILRGGNLAVLNGLAATPYDILSIGDENEDVILFFEDISEPIYAIERMLWRLSLSGSLRKVKGLIFGQFTEYQPDKNFQTVEDMVSYWLDKMDIANDIPVVFNFPIGHVDLNFPLTVGATVELEVQSDKVRLHTL